MGCPIRKSPDQSSFAAPQRLIAAYRVLHRLLAPRHSPYALSSLTIGMQGLTIGAPLLLRSVRDNPSSSPSLKTLRVFCDYGKNYRLQDIQLSKNSRGTSSRRTTRSLATFDLAQVAPSIVEGRGPLGSPLRSRGPLTLVRGRVAVIVRCDENLWQALHACLAEARGIAAGEGWWRIPGSNR